jgi:LuxR family transcriptional activator of conjugal transfer of Ti plasmids
VTRTDETLKNALTDLVLDLGFDRYAYLNVHPSRTYAVSNYPAEWQKLYFEENYLQVDPVVKTAGSTLRAFTWSAPHPGQCETKEVRRFFMNADAFGIRSGISIPVRTACQHMSMLTLASGKTALSLDKDIDQIAAITAVALLHARIEDQHAVPTAHQSCDLTPRQAVCLKWSAEGKSMKAIATIENMSFATVNFHLNNARKALGAGSLAQATAIATRLGLI